MKADITPAPRKARQSKRGRLNLARAKWIAHRACMIAVIPTLLIPGVGGTVIGGDDTRIPKTPLP
jgi:hypothetical protein